MDTEKEPLITLTPEQLFEGLSYGDLVKHNETHEQAAYRIIERQEQIGYTICRQCLIRALDSWLDHIMEQQFNG